MKKFIYVSILSCVSLWSTSCLKSKDYTCKCTYIHSTSLLDSIPKPNIVEQEIVKGRLQEQAQTECSFLEDKYFSNNYDGTCLLQ